MAGEITNFQDLKIYNQEMFDELENNIINSTKVVLASVFVATVALSLMIFNLKK